VPKELTLTELRHFLCGKVGAQRPPRGVTMDQLWITHGFIWFYMVLYGFIWFYMVLYGFIWFCMVYMVLRGFMWFNRD